MKKFISGLTSLCMSVSLTAGALSAFTATALDGVAVAKTFSLKSDKTTISAEEIAAGDVTINIGLYLSETEANTRAFQTNVIFTDVPDASAVKFVSVTDPTLDILDEYEYTFTDGPYAGRTVKTDKRLFFAGTVTSRDKLTYGNASMMFSQVLDAKATISMDNRDGFTWLGATSDAFPVVEYGVTFSKDAAPGDYYIDFDNGPSNNATPPLSLTHLGLTDLQAPILDRDFRGALDTKGIVITVGGDVEPTEPSTAPTESSTEPSTAPTNPTNPTNPTEPDVDYPAGTLVFGADDVEISLEDLAADGYYLEVPILVKQTNDEEIAGAGFTFNIGGGLDYTWLVEETSAKNTAYGTTNKYNPAQNRMNFVCSSVVDSKNTGKFAETGSEIVKLAFEFTDAVQPGKYPVTLSLETYGTSADAIVKIVDPTSTDTEPATVAFAVGYITITGDELPTEPSTAPTEPSTAPSTAPTEPGTVLYGDTNCDGEVTIADVVRLDKYLVDAVAYDMSEQGKINAEVDLDGNITTADATAIINSIVKNVTLPIK